MKYLTIFVNHIAYQSYINGSTYVTPNISLCTYERELHYNPYEPNNLLDINLLDILYSDENENLYIYNTVLPVSEGKTPIGLCVAPTGFFGKNEPARWMSLKHMNYTTPETGSITGQNIAVGQYGVDIATIPNISKTYVNGSNYGCLTADWINSTDSNIPPLFTEDYNWNISVLGTVNEFAVTDIDGKSKTNKWLEAATAQPNWQTDSTIINNTGEGYSSAACCCARYHTLGTSAGDWYLGAGGEMSIIAVLRDDINAKLQQINTIYPNNCIASLGNAYYWTSTEYSANNLYRIGINNGNVSYRTKVDYCHVLAMLHYNPYV